MIDETRYRPWEDDEERWLTFEDLLLIRGSPPDDEPRREVPPLPDDPRRQLRGTELRYALVRLVQLIGPATVPELIDGLRYWGFTVGGRPSKTVADALRWERRRDRVRKVGRGIYWSGVMPRSTEHRIIRRVIALRAALEELSLEGGQKS